MVQNLLFNSSCDITYLSHSLSLCHVFVWSFCVAMCQGVLPQISLARNTFLTEAIPLCEKYKLYISRQTQQLLCLMWIIYTCKNILFNPSAVNISLPHSHIMYKTSIWPSYEAMCQAVRLHQSLAKNMLFNSSCLRTHFTQVHILFNTSVWLFYATMCQTVFSSPSLAKNMSFNSSCDSTHFAQSHILFNP